MTAKRTTIHLSEAGRDKLLALAERYGTQTHVIEVALDRMYREEIKMSKRTLADLAAEFGANGAWYRDAGQGAGYPPQMVDLDHQVDGQPIQDVELTEVEPDTWISDWVISEESYQDFPSNPYRYQVAFAPDNPWTD